MTTHTSSFLFSSLFFLLNPTPLPPPPPPTPPLQLIRYLTLFTSEPLLTYTLVIPSFILSLLQTCFVVGWTYKQLIEDWGEMGGLIKHGFVSPSPRRFFPETLAPKLRGP